ncbi:MAG: DUF3536 domain-containing protein [Chitinispirillales bacterium]|nr:DUF3536 domain-containing protein [Chitinispirillales bacterium]
MTGNKFLVIHGHFYQPPRENPWLDIIEEQESAAPYHDWNERIYDECYRPNAYSRLLDSKGMIVGIHNNYQNMSFNFGPTLFTWLERYHPVTARKIIAADRESASRFGGHGNAVAQVFNHVIMPLASKRDQLTQIRWAKYFFKKRYGRDPQGIWLGETAINMVTVECLIEEKISYVILSPNQAESFRSLNDGNWTHTNQQPIDTRRPYRIFPRTQSGEQLEGRLDVFFFDEGLSKEISFNDLLKDSRVLGSRINECYDQNNGSNQLVTIATDGETFGHHKAFGDMCLAFFFKSIASELGIIPVNFSYYLSMNPPQHEVSLRNAFGEGTAWSCAHGVGRWIRDCGCSTGGEAGWNQAWRAPLRSALNELQAQIDSHYEARLSTLFADPWVLRDKYIRVMGESSLAKTAEFLKHYAVKFTFNDELTAEIRRLLEAQKFMLFSYTSCGWFFNDISGIETVQNLAYACRALQLGLPEVSRKLALFQFMEQLSKAKSNLKDTDGRTLFEKHVLPFFHHKRLLAFTAAAQQVLAVKKYSSYEKTVYNLELKSIMSQKAGRMNYDVVSVQLESGITGESSSWSVLIAHSPETELMGWVVPSKGMRTGTTKTEAWTSHPDVKTFTLSDLFYSSRHDLSDFFQDRMAKDTDKRFLGWMEQNEPNLNVLTRLNYPLPAYCSTPVRYVLQNRWNTQIHKLRKWGSENEVFADLQEIDALEKRYAMKIDKKQSALTLQNLIIRGLEMLQQELSIEICDRLRYLLNFVDKFSIPVSKSKLEDIFHPVYEGPLKNLYASQKSEEKELLSNLISFARRMNFNTDSFN